MNISVVIPNYNGEQLLKNLPHILDILEHYKNGKSELIITDDASKDNSVALLHEFAQKNTKSSVHIVILENTSGKNKGFATNVNKGVREATGEIVILLNTDVFPRDDFLQSLLTHFKDREIFATGCLDESVENGDIVLRGRGTGQWHRGFLMHAPADVESSPTTLWVSCGSGAFRKEMWDKLGGLCELYNPFYWEDIDLSYRALKAGYKIVFEKRSRVRHQHETGSIKKNYSSSQIKKIVYRNQFFFTWLNATDTMILISHVCFLPIFFLKALVGKDYAFIQGFLKALVRLPEVLKERQIVQRFVKKSDKEVIAEIIK